jgi:hypothetical protein
MALAAASCSHVRVNEDGSTRIVGFVAMTLPPPANAAELKKTSTPVLSATSWGLSWFGSPIGYSLSLGYTRDSITRIGLPETLAELTTPSSNGDGACGPPHAAVLTGVSK